MSAKATIVKEIAARLLNNEAAKTVDLFNEQIIHDNKETYERPAVFIEFATTEYIPYQKGSQKGVLNIALHIILDDYARDLDKFFDAIELIHQYMQNFKPSVASSKMERTTEVHDTDHERLADWTAFYQMGIEDQSGDERNLLESGQIVFEITKCIGATIQVTPVQGGTNKLVNVVYEEGADNVVQFDVLSNQAGTYSTVDGTNTDSVTVEIDTGGGFSVVAVPFVLQVGNEAKITIDRTDDAAQSAVIIQGIS